MSTVQGGWRGPNITKDGLLIYLDPSSPNSYYQLQGGTTLKDISGNGNNGSLVNTPTFSTTVGGMFTFNGTNQYINCGNSATLQITQGTISTWIRATNGNSSFRGIVTKQNAWGLFLYNNVLIAFDWGNYLATCPSCNINAGIRSTGINLGTNTWTNVTMTFTQTVGTVLPGPPNSNVIIYVNGLPVLTTTTLNSAQTAPIQFGWANFTGQYLVGSIAQGLIYNRVLTPTEVLQNYNATRSRFGI
jgi:hypothetical protein